MSKTRFRKPRLAEDSQKPPLKRRKLRNVPVLPTLLTLGNLICGFAAIHFCMTAVANPHSNMTNIFPIKTAETVRGHLLETFLSTPMSIAGALLFLGMLFDMLDGRIARLTNRMSNFGGQLDTLADVVSFGVAPGILTITLLTRVENDLMLIPPRTIWIVSAVYVCCAAMRLAKFNVENAQVDAIGHKLFHGLPSPGAAAVVASLVILHQNLGNAGDFIIGNLLALIALTTGLLMVSNVPYIHIGNKYFKGKKPLWHLGLYILGFGVFLWQPAWTLALVTCTYAATGPISALFIRLFPLKPSAGNDNEQKDIQDSEESSSVG